MGNYSIFILFSCEELILSQNIIFFNWDLVITITFFEFSSSQFLVQRIHVYMYIYMLRNGMRKLATPQPMSKTLATLQNVDQLSHWLTYYLTWIYNKIKWRLNYVNKNKKNIDPNTNFKVVNTNSWRDSWVL